jgi:hypothetical protein
MKIDAISSRPAEYLNDSGVASLTSGSAFVVMGISQLIWPILAHTHPNSALVVQSGGTVLVMLVLFAGMKLKQRFVFPRAGYAVPRRSPVRVLVALGLSCVFLVLLARGGHWALVVALPSAAPGFAVVFALIAASTARQQKSNLGYWFALYLLCLGAVLWCTHPNVFAGMSWLQIGIGGPLAVYGAVRLRKFIEANPEAIETAE